MRRLGIIIPIGVIALLSASVILDPNTVSRWIEGLFGIRPTEAPVSLVPDAGRYDAVATMIQPDDIRARIEQLSQHSRVAGTDGDAAAFDLVKKVFEQYLPRVDVEEFDVAVPVDLGAKLTEPSGQTLPVYCLWPNHVRTPTLPRGGVSGPIIDGGRGEFADFDGKPLDGSICLMNFNSGQNYINARTLGARAILFYDNGEVGRGQAADKFLPVPVDIPRFWIDKASVARLKHLAEQGAAVHLEAHMEWQRRTCRNILGYLPGLDESMAKGEGGEDINWADKLLVISAYYDSMSVVPAAAPGADQACGIAALLEMIRVFRTGPADLRPKASICFVATSGHFLGLSGIENFVYRHARERRSFKQEIEAAGQQLAISLLCTLDLSSHNDRVGAFFFGDYARFAPWVANEVYVEDLCRPYGDRLNVLAGELFGAQQGRFISAVKPPKREWRNFVPIGMAFDCEIAGLMGTRSLTLATTDDLRPFVDTPCDTLDRVDLDNATRQANTVTALLLRASRDSELLMTDELRCSLKLEDFGTDVEGKIVQWDREASFFVPVGRVPNALVTNIRPDVENTLAGVRTLSVVMTRELVVGRPGERPRPPQPDDPPRAMADWFIIPTIRYPYFPIYAYGLNDDGEIVYAPDLGMEGDLSYPTKPRLTGDRTEMMEVVFPCRGLSIFEIIDPRYLSALDVMTVLTPGGAEPQAYSSMYLEKQSQKEGKATQAAVVFAGPKDRVKILMGTSLFGAKYLLTNAPAELLENPVDPGRINDKIVNDSMGLGYPVAAGIVKMPCYEVAKDLWVIDDIRMKQMLLHSIRNQKVEALHGQAREELQQAGEHLRARRYEQFIAAVRRAWGLESRGYPDVRSTANDTVHGVVFYFVLLLPFCLFVERLLCGFAHIYSRLAAVAGIFLVVFAILHVVHPAFKLSQSPYVILLAFVIFAISTTVMVIVLAKFNASLQRSRRAAAGIHEADVGRVSSLAAAVSLGVSNLRKHRLRTTLTVLTLVLLTFSVLSFTSFSTSIEFYRIHHHDKAAFRGALIRDRSWLGMQPSVLEYVRSAFSDSAWIVPRAWYVSKKKGGDTFVDFANPATGQTLFAKALVGFTPDELRAGKLLTDDAGHHRPGTIADALIPGSRWFAPDDGLVCLLPTNLAELVGITPDQIGTAQITMMGRSFKVIGLTDEAVLNRMLDLDAERVTPVDTKAEAGKMAPIEDPQVVAAAPVQALEHIDANSTIFVPYQFVMDNDGTLRSVAVVFRDEADFTERIERFMSRVAMTVFVGEENGSVVYSSIGRTSISGARDLIVAILIAALIVLNTMIAAVHERTREIGIYSSVGLAPSHVGALFFAESAVFAVVGAVLGYLVGQVVAAGLSRMGWLSSLTLNYSSLSATWSTLIVMLTVFLSTIYPARKAAAMAVPDVTRRWQFPPPQGDRWEFEFPFTVAGADVQGMYAYLYHVFASFGEAPIGDFHTAGLVAATRPGPAGPEHHLEMDCWLKPYDLGISQHVAMTAISTGERDVHAIRVKILRLSGAWSAWTRMNRSFLNVLRKRFLVWRTMGQEEKQSYRDRWAGMAGVGALAG